MTQIKVSEASGPALDWMVAKCEFKSHVLNFVSGSEYRGNREEYTKPRFQWVRGIATPCTLQDAERLYEIETTSYYSPTASWGIGGPIIEREGMWLRANDSCTEWACGALRVNRFDNTPGSLYYGPTPLIAAMRCHVASKLGDVVEVPDELIGA